MALESARGDPLGKVWFPHTCASAHRIYRAGVAGRNSPAEVAAENAKRLKRGGDFLRKTAFACSRVKAVCYRPMEKPYEMSCSCTDCGFIFSLTVLLRRNTFFHSNLR